MAEIDKKPEIRFNGFTDAWEQRELETVYDKIRNAFVGTASPYYVPQGNFYLESNNVKDGQINRNSEIFINDEFYLRQKDNWLRTGDMVMVQSGHVGHAAVIPPELNNSAAHALIIFSNPKEIINPYFLNYQYQTSNYKKAIDNITTGNTIKHILSSEMKKFTVLLTEIEEQNKISEFLVEFDNLITLHQRKYDKLVIIKKSMLAKMFPKEGANVPEIRFAEFTDIWKQKKLGEIANKVTEKNDNQQFIETFTNSAEFGIISQRDFFDYDISNVENINKYYVVKAEDFVYNPRISTFAPLGPINRNKLGRTGVMSPLYTVFRTHDIDNAFLEQYFKSTYWYSFMNLNGDTGARADRFSIKDSVFLEMPIPYPDSNEQLKIGEYLTNLDNLIALHQHELEKLKNIKTALLEKMFV